MRYAVILNPAADHGKAGRRQAALEAALRRAGLAYVLQRTDAPGHAATLAEQAASGFDVVVAAGGDGTIHEVCRGLVAAGAAAPLGVIPFGTGNDFVKALGVPRRLEAAARCLASAHPRAVDYGVARWDDGAGLRERVFVNAVGAGFDAAVALRAAAYKYLPGAAGYLAAVPGALRRWRGPTVRITGQAGSGPPALLHNGPLLLVTAGNGVSSGGRFFLTPHASLMDGLLDVCIVEDTPPRRVLQVLPKALRGTHAAAPEVRTARVRALTLAAPSGLPLHADGEVLARRAYHVEVGVIAGGLTALVPART